MLKRNFTLLLCTLLAASTFSQEIDSLSFDEYIINAMKQFELPALSISVTNENENIFKKAYGVKSLKTDEKIDSKSVFAIASLSKAFTAAALGILVDDGKIGWKDKVVKYLPDFSLIDTVVSNRMTIEDLLSHRSGYKTFDGDLLWYATDYSRSEIIDRFAKRKMSYGFRDDYGYQNIMFIVAGEIIPAVTGKSWDDFIEERIFEPLEMNSSYTSIDDFPEDINLALPHVNGELDMLRSYSNSGGAAALNSNVEDLSKWIRMWLNEGIVDGDTVISPSTINRLLEMTTPIGPSNFEKSIGIDFDGYALGWFVMEYEGEKVAHHGGGLPGYISKVFIVPSQKIGGVVLTNDMSSLPQAMMYRTLDELLQKEEKTDWAGVYHNFSMAYENRLAKEQEEIDSKRQKGTQAELKLKAYAGLYSDAMYGDAKIEFKKGQLFLTLLPTKEIFSSELYHWENNRFEIKFKDIFLPRGFVDFNIENGQVKNFTIDLPNPDFHFYNLNFVKQEEE